MQREVKFRAWDKKGGEWKMPLYIDFLGDSKFFFSDPEDELVFQQFTGLKDKNGKEIYELELQGPINLKKELKK